MCIECCSKAKNTSATILCCFKVRFFLYLRTILFLSVPPHKNLGMFGHYLLLGMIITFCSLTTNALNCHCTNQNSHLHTSETECDSNHFCSIEAKNCNASHPFPSCMSHVKYDDASTTIMEQSCVCQSLEKVINSLL